MRIVRSFVAGLEKVVQFPSLIAWLYLTSVLLTVPLALSMRTLLKDSLGSSLVHENLRQGFDMDWYGEFSSGSAGLADSFGPSVVGSLPILSNLEKLIDGEILQADGTILLAGLLFLLAWAFFAGGTLDRYAHPDELPTRARFFSQNGEYFFRFVRLLIISLLFYWGIFRWVANPLHDWLEDASRDATQEKTVILFTLLVYALVAFLLLLVSLVLDYAKIALVVERRHSALLACLCGARFVLTHPGLSPGSLPAPDRRQPATGVALQLGGAGPRTVGAGHHPAGLPGGTDLPDCPLGPEALVSGRPNRPVPGGRATPLKPAPLLLVPTRFP